MKRWLNFSPLLIEGITNVEPIRIEELTDASCLIHDILKSYFIIHRKFRNRQIPKIQKYYTYGSTVIIVNAPEDIKAGRKILNCEYGDHDAFIFDMNGIDNFRFARSMVFKDYTVRKIVMKMGLLNAGEQYLRYGAAGARVNGEHPGGEVFEYCGIEGSHLNGISQSVSGYLPERDFGYSKSVKLCEPKEFKMLEERIVYSHTAWLKKVGNEKSNVSIIKFITKDNKTSALDMLDYVRNLLGIRAFAAQIYIHNVKNGDVTFIKGRVLKHMPTAPFEYLQEATDIAVEQIFPLVGVARMYGVGTLYDRYEPDWEQFACGRKYEKRGHFHCTIVNNNNSVDIHETFHLRDIFLSEGAEVLIALTPVENVYRIYPVSKEGNDYYCDTNKVNIKDMISNINEYDRMDKD